MFLCSPGVKPDSGVRMAPRRLGEEDRWSSMSTGTRILIWVRSLLFSTMSGAMLRSLYAVVDEYVPSEALSENVCRQISV